MLFFFVPYGLMTAELGAAWPGEGGLYVWVREAMGSRWGSLAAWFYWINMAYWIPSVYMVFAGTFHTIFLKASLPPALQEGAGATWLQAGIAIVATWMSVLLGRRAAVGREVGAERRRGGEGRDLPGPGRPRPRVVARRAARRRTRSRWPASSRAACTRCSSCPVLVYNALGFELMSSAGEEMRDPQRDVPRVVLLSGVVISVVYVLGVLGILLAVPLSELSLLTGTWDALAALGPALRRGRRRGGPAARPRVPLRLRREHRDLEPRLQPRGGGRGGGAARCPRSLGRLHPALQHAVARVRVDGRHQHGAARRQRAPWPRTRRTRSG